MGCFCEFGCSMMYDVFVMIFMIIWMITVTWWVFRHRYLPLFLTIYLSIIYLSLSMIFMMTVTWWIFRHRYLPIYINIHIFIYLSIYLSIYVSIYLSGHLSISIYALHDHSHVAKVPTYLSILPSIYISIYLPIYHLPCSSWSSRIWVIAVPSDTLYQSGIFIDQFQLF